MLCVISVGRFCEFKTPLLSERQFCEETLMRSDGGELGQNRNIEIPCLFSAEQDPGSLGKAPVS